MVVLVKPKIAATVPLNVTVLFPGPPKFVPTIKTEEPTGPEVGVRLVIVGGGGLTTSVAVEVCVSAGFVLVPVTVKTYVPAAVVELVVIVRAEDVPVAGLGLNVPLAPVGKPLIDSDTEPVNPPVAAMFSV